MLQLPSVLISFMFGCLFMHVRMQLQSGIETNTSKPVVASTGAADGVGKPEGNGSTERSSSSSSSSTTGTTTTAQNGWRSIEVFYGKLQDPRPPSESATSNTNRWFSQSEQDQIVSRLLKQKRHGYFVDLAANDARKWSNSLALERDFGWEGLCIEPNPQYW